MQREKKTRNSSGELIRILAMLMIVISHYSTHGKIDIYQYAPRANASLLYLQLLSMGGNIGLNLFIIVSGYYLSSSKFKIERIVSIVSHTTLYTVICYVICSGGAFILQDIMQAVFPVVYNQYWFITGYVGLYCIFPYINLTLEQLDKFGFRKLIVVLFFMMSLIPFIFNTNFVLSDLPWFVFMYCIGAYLRKYGIPEVLNYWKLWIAGSTFIVLCLLVIIFHYTGNFIPLFRIHATYFNAKESPLIVLLVVMLFSIIMDIHISSTVINKVGACMMGVYLFHENPYVRSTIWNYVNNSQYYDSTLKLVINSICTTIIVCGAGCIIELFISKINDILTTVICKVIGGRTSGDRI